MYTLYIDDKVLDAGVGVGQSPLSAILRVVINDPF